MPAAPREQVYASEDAGRPPLILTFEVAAVAPFQHEQGEAVAPLDDEAGYIDLARRVRDLRIAGEAAVHPEVEAGVDALEVYVGTPLRRERNVAQIKPRGVLARNEGRVVGEGVAHVYVGGLAVTVKLPDGGHGQRPVRQGEVRADGFLRHRLGRGEEGEAPFAAERREKRRSLAVRVGGSGLTRRNGVALGVGDVIRPQRLAAYMQFSGILMVFKFHSPTALIDEPIIP